MASFPEPERPSSESADLTSDLRRYFRIVRKRKWAIAAAAAVTVTAAVLYTLRQPKIYEATGSVEIEPVAPQVFGREVQEVVTLGAGNYWSNVEYYNTQIELIEGYDLCVDTVEKNRLQDDERLVPPQVQSTKGERERVEYAAGVLCGGLSARLGGDSRIVYVSVRHQNRELARDLANLHIKRYREANMERRQVDTVDAKGLISGLLDESRDTLREAEDALLAFKEKHELVSVSLEDKLNRVATDLSRYNDAHSTARVERLRLAALLANARKAMNKNLLESPIFALRERPGIAILKGQYIEEKQRFVEIGQTYGAKHPTYQAQEKKVRDLAQELEAEARLALTEIEAQHQVALATEEKYAAEAARLHAAALALAPITVEHDRLKRARENAAENNELLVNRYRASSLSASRRQVGNNIRLHTRARLPASPVLPRMNLNVALALLLGLGLGLALAFALEYMDRTVKTTEDVEVSTNSPLLGLIPVVSDVPDTEEAQRERDLYVFTHPKSRPAECTRSIRTNLLFSSAERRLRVVCVSSPNPREGKTTTCIYLGTTMAQSGQRVLLVDTDMRRPRLHKSMGISRGTGISNLILGDSSDLGEISYDEAIKTTDIPNLYVLPCGPTPPNPAELLLTKRFSEILDELRQRFDWVLLDTPPLNAVTDAAVMAKLCDGVILVAQANRTARDDLARAARQLRDIQAKTVGVILNDLDMSERSYGDYYYHYGYGETEAESGKA